MDYGIHKPRLFLRNYLFSIFLIQVERKKIFKIFFSKNNFAKVVLRYHFTDASISAMSAALNSYNAYTCASIAASKSAVDALGCACFCCNTCATRAMMGCCCVSETSTIGNCSIYLGLGIGIDRLTMFLTNNASIQEVLFFPQMKPEKG
jgi:hypothetical protein